ncbi:MAG TPA: transglycosylase SLT domain-containing protein [Candidatus Acidoferrales bacterium]|nr:transglycosylase SLT domain-containing protein [Candidatus Acidoferrales bacterium]
MKRPHIRGLFIRIVIFVIIGAAIVLTGEIDAARYTYDSTVVPESSIPKLDRKTYIFLSEYGKQLQKISYEYGVDWRLALAVLRAESGFDPEATSYKGASGFMQLMPVTGLQLASSHNVDDLSDPVDNILLGVIQLRDMLRNYSDCDGDDRLELAVAAYNCGLGRIQDAQSVAEFLGDKPTLWLSVKSALPLLSVRYSPLHEHIWQNGKPSFGTFGSYEETLTYVENVMHYYNIYRNVLHE